MMKTWRKEAVMKWMLVVLAFAPTARPASVEPPRKGFIALDEAVVKALAR